MRANEMAPLLTRTGGSAPVLTQRQVAVRDAADREAAEIDRWQALNAYFHDEDARYLQFLIPAGLRIRQHTQAPGFSGQRVSGTEGTERPHRGNRHLVPANDRFQPPRGRLRPEPRPGAALGWVPT